MSAENMDVKKVVDVLVKELSEANIFLARWRNGYVDQIKLLDDAIARNQNAISKAKAP